MWIYPIGKKKCCRRKKYISGGRSALALRESVPTTRFPKFLCSLVAPARFLRLSLIKVPASKLSSREAVTFFVISLTNECWVPHSSRPLA